MKSNETESARSAVRSTDGFDGAVEAEKHIPDIGPMSFARWNARGGYRFCSCGKWHYEERAA